MDANALYEAITKAAFACWMDKHDHDADTMAANAVLTYEGDINEPVSSGRHAGSTMLYAATTTSGALPTTLRALRARGADASNLKFLASTKCTAAVVEVFPEVSFNYTFANGQTPLHIAAEGANHEDVIRFYLAHGASKTSVDRQGRTPFDMALRNTFSHVSRIQTLLA